MLRGCVRAAVAVVALAVAGNASAAPAAVLTREQAVARALSENPEIQSLEAAVEAAQGVLGADRRILRNNPVVDGAVGPRNGADDDTLDWSVGVTQELEIAGQRGDRIALREAELLAARARLEARAVALAAEVRQAFGAALAARERQQLAGEATRLAQEALAAANERLEAGAGTRLEVNTARVELGRAMRERGVAEQQQAAAENNLALLLAVGADAGLQLTGNLGGQLTGSAAALREQAKQRMDLIAAELQLDAAKAAAKLAAAEGFPDIAVGASYRQEEGDRIVQGTLAVPLPIFDRNQEGRALATAQVRQAAAELAALQRRVEAELQLALSRYETARATVDAFGNDAVQALEQNLEMVNEAYRAGKIDFLQLLLVRRETLASQQAWIDAQEDLDRAEAEVLRVLGRLE